MRARFLRVSSAIPEGEIRQARAIAFASAAATGLYGDALIDGSGCLFVSELRTEPTLATVHASATTPGPSALLRADV